MLLIILSWIYILILSSVVGIGSVSLLRLKDQDTIITLFYGFFGVTLFASFWALFFPVNWQFHLVLFILCCVFGFKLKGHLNRFILKIWDEMRSLSLIFKISFVIIFLLIVAQCSSSPYVLDNESYYIQTIKWLNEFGFVKGLVNLHIFLGQYSGWHILQSAFNFSFLYDHFNDLSGFCLLMGNFFALKKLNFYLNVDDSNVMNLIVGLFPIGNIFFFQFISAPSPDIAIYVISFIIFYVFHKNYLKSSISGLTSLALLSMFVIFIKVTAIVVAIFPLIVLVKNYAKFKKDLKPIVAIGVISLLIFIIKNYIITGNMLYPLVGIEAINASWSLPGEIQEFYLLQNKSTIFNLTHQQYQHGSLFYLFKNWVFQYGLTGFLNKVMILLLLVSPMFFLRKKYNSSMKVIYVVAWINLIFLFMTSPQFRFFFQFLYILSLAMMVIVITNKKVLILLSTMSFLLPLLYLFLNLDLSKLTTNNFYSSVSKASFETLIEPHGNSRFESDFEVYKIGNLNVNSPTKIDFFWGTGDLDVPSLNREQCEYFKTNFGVVPQLRSTDLRDGFNSQKVAELK